MKDNDGAVSDDISYGLPKHSCVAAEPEITGHSIPEYTPAMGPAGPRDKARRDVTVRRTNQSRLMPRHFGNHSAAFLKLLDTRFARSLPEVQMSDTMIPNLVARRRKSVNRVCVFRDPGCRHEKRGLGPKRGKYIKDARCETGVRTIIEAEEHPALV